MGGLLFLRLVFRQRVELCDGGPLYVSIEVHVLHGSADFGMVHQLLWHRAVAAPAHELGAERLAADVPGDT